MHEDNSSRDVGAFDLLAILWRGKFVIALTTILALVAAGMLYFSLPRSYEASVDIEPLSQSEFANFRHLVTSELFPYDRVSLFNEFVRYLRDTDLLIPAAVESGAVQGDSGSEAETRRSVIGFVSGIEFSRPREDEAVVRMRVRGGDMAALDRFVQTAIASANAYFARQIHFEVSQRLAAEQERRSVQIEGLKIQIEARRETEESLRQDRIEILRKQAEIARLLGLEKPIEVLPVNGQSQGEGVSVQVNSGSQPAFMQGYLALEEQIRQLETRDKTDAYIDDLRQLEQQVFLLQNNPDPAFQAQLLENSGLNNPEDVKLVRYDAVRAAAQKVSPSVTVFGPTALILGLLAGMLIVLWRAQSSNRDVKGQKRV